MPRKPQTTPNKPAQPKFLGFINYDLTKEESARLKGRVMTLDEFETEMLRLNDEGYKVSLSYDAYHKCYGCFFSHRDPDHDNAGYILSGRGSTPFKAFKQALYIHFQVFDGVWGRDRATNAELDD